MLNDLLFSLVLRGDLFVLITAWVGVPVCACICQYVNIYASLELLELVCVAVNSVALMGVLDDIISGLLYAGLNI
jgi:hypothetical protein